MHRYDQEQQGSLGDHKNAHDRVDDANTRENLKRNAKRHRDVEWVSLSALASRWSDPDCRTLHLESPAQFLACV